MTVAQYRIPSVVTHQVSWRCSDYEQMYQIQVMQPLSKVAAEERFPVLYLTDANASFDFAKGISHCLQSTERLQRYILVGIGYPGDNPFAGDILRCRDLTPEARPQFPGISEVSNIEGVQGVHSGTRSWGGAGAFSEFIRGKLFPFIDASYRTIPGDRGYFGHSLGGAFGLHALFAETELFSRYALSSPGISYDGDDFGIREALRYVSSGKPLRASVFMSVGEEEEFEVDYEKGAMVSNFYRLAAILRKAEIRDLTLKTRVFSGETHISVWPLAFSHAVQFLYGKEGCAVKAANSLTMPRGHGEESNK